MGTTFSETFLKAAFFICSSIPGSVQLLVALSLLFHPRNGVNPMPKARTHRTAMTPLARLPVTKLLYLFKRISFVMVSLRYSATKGQKPTSTSVLP